MGAKKGSYRLSPLAGSDLEDIWNYTVEAWSTQQAEIYHASLIAAIEGLSQGKHIGRISNVRVGYFKFAVGQHIIFFKQSGAGIEVIRILHQGMDVSRHL